jgi:hypothetical protein
VSIDAWRPSKRQLETIAECAAARIDAARTARLLGVSEPTFMAWTKRLAAGVAEEERLVAAFLARPRGEAHELAEFSAFGGGLP